MMIPEAHLPAVQRALLAALGAADIDDVRPLTAGLSSALVFRIVVRGRPYLLRVITRTDAAADPTNQYACMKIAADAGLAPRIWYAGIEDRILLSDFIDAAPLPDHPAPLFGATVRKVHALPPFTKRMDYLGFLEGVVRRFQGAKVLPEGRTSAALLGFDAANKVYPRDTADYVSSHNDSKPDNMIFDGTRIWLVDWEAAWLNDRYVDLAIVANFFVRNDSDEESYLRRYFDRPVTEYERARFYVMQQMMHMCYAGFLIMLATGAGAALAPDTPAPDFADFHQRLVSGGIRLAGNDARLQYGLTHLDRATTNMRTARFQHALAVLASA
jgi:aminoglycoside phosphotransferase